MSDKEEPQAPASEATPPQVEGPPAAAEPARPAPPQAKPPAAPVPPRQPFGPRRSKPRAGPVRTLEEMPMPRSELHLKELDAEIEGELQAALADLSDKDLKGGEGPGGTPAAAPG